MESHTMRALQRMTLHPNGSRVHRVKVNFGARAPAAGTPVATSNHGLATNHGVSVLSVSILPEKSIGEISVINFGDRPFDVDWGAELGSVSFV